MPSNTPSIIQSLEQAICGAARRLRTRGESIEEWEQELRGDLYCRLVAHRPSAEVVSTPFALRVLKHIEVDHIRDRERRRRLGAVLPDLARHTADQMRSRTPEMGAAWCEDLRQSSMRWARTLRPRERAVLSRVRRGKRLAVIAEELHCPIGTVASIVYRTRQRLCAALELESN